MKPALESNVWVPMSRAGHLQLFYFAMFIAVLGIGGNIAIRHVLASIIKASNLL